MDSPLFFRFQTVLATLADFAIAGAALTFIFVSFAGAPPEPEACLLKEGAGAKEFADLLVAQPPDVLDAITAELMAAIAPDPAQGHEI